MKLKSKHVVYVYDDYTERPCDETSQVYLKSEADKVIAGKDEEIAELKQKLHDAEMLANLAEAAETERKIDYDNLKAEFQKQKESYAKLDLDYQQRLGFGFSKTLSEEHRQTLRELWLARAERAKDKQAYYTHIRGDGWVHLVDKWINVERKCLKKAEEYK